MHMSAGASVSVCVCVCVRTHAYNSLYGHDFALYKYYYYNCTCYKTSFRKHTICITPLTERNSLISLEVI